MKRIARKIGTIFLALSILVSVSPIMGWKTLANESDTDTPVAAEGSENDKKDTSVSKETKKAAAPKEEKKPEAETKAPKEKEKAETEAPKETEKAETEAPKETVKAETEAPKETEKTETEAPKETEKAETEEPKETEKTETEIPKETENTETEAPKETDETNLEAPKETDPAETEKPKESKNEEKVTNGRPEENENRTAKKSVQIDAALSENGVLTWKDIAGVDSYGVAVDNYCYCFTDVEQYESWFSYNAADKTYSIDLHKTVDLMIKGFDLEKSSDNDYQICLFAFADSSAVANREFVMHYVSKAKPIKVGKIYGVKLSGKTLSWTKPKGSTRFEVELGSYFDTYVSKNSFDIGSVIDKLITNREMFKKKTYAVYLSAYDKDGVTIARWSGNLTYKSSATPCPLPQIDASIEGDILTYKPFSGAREYAIRIVGANTRWLYGGYSVNLKEGIAELIEWEGLKEVSSYRIEVYAYADIDKICAEWIGSYKYKEANTLSVSGKTAKVKKKKVKKKTQYLSVYKVLKFRSTGQGTKTYKKISGNKKITINSKSGKVTVKKKLKKGTYKVRVRVRASGNETYAPIEKTVTFKIKVK